MSELNPRAGGMEVGKDEGVTLRPAEKQSEGGWDTMWRRDQARVLRPRQGSA